MISIFNLILSASSLFFLVCILQFSFIPSSSTTIEHSVVSAIPREHTVISRSSQAKMQKIYGLQVDILVLLEREASHHCLSCFATCGPASFHLVLKQFNISLVSAISRENAVISRLSQAKMQKIYGHVEVLVVLELAVPTHCLPCSTTFGRSSFIASFSKTIRHSIVLKENAVISRLSRAKMQKICGLQVDILVLPYALSSLSLSLYITLVKHHTTLPHPRCMGENLVYFIDASNDGILTTRVTPPPLSLMNDEPP